MRPLTELCLLAKKHETDKGGRHWRYGGGDSDTCHEYTTVYSDLFAHRRHEVRAVMEIGVNAGCSLRMWEEYFPNARIIGVDCEKHTLFNAGRIACYQADQNNPAQLRGVLVCAGAGPYDLIVDDGSHELEHQITSMATLLPALALDGVYVIEDLNVDCRPEWVGRHVPEGFTWAAVPCEIGTGRAHCPCAECGGKGPEQLIVITRSKSCVSL